MYALRSSFLRLVDGTVRAPFFSKYKISSGPIRAGSGLTKYGRFCTGGNRGLLDGEKYCPSDNDGLCCSTGKGDDEAGILLNGNRRFKV
jgi:hypothetical protein